MDRMDEPVPVVLRRKWVLKAVVADKEIMEALGAELERQFRLELERAIPVMQLRAFGVAGLPRPGSIVLS